MRKVLTITRKSNESDFGGLYIHVNILFLSLLWHLDSSLLEYLASVLSLVELGMSGKHDID